MSASESLADSVSSIFLRFVMIEREACARLAEEMAQELRLVPHGNYGALLELAARIRARGEEAQS